MKSLPKRLEVIKTAKQGLILEWAAQQAHMGVMVLCPQTFGHILYVYVGVFSFALLSLVIALL